MTAIGLISAMTKRGREVERHFPAGDLELFKYTREIFDLQSKRSTGRDANHMQIANQKATGNAKMDGGCFHGHQLYCSIVS
jgi:hypothetical protein